MLHTLQLWIISHPAHTLHPTTIQNLNLPDKLVSTEKSIIDTWWEGLKKYFLGIFLGHVYKEAESQISES